VVTKRDIYYHDPALFKKQETVDRYIDDIAHTCKVKRWDLNVVRLTQQGLSREANNEHQTASPKGLVAGLRHGNGEDQAAVIHASCDRTAFDRLPPLNWILVVEKEVRAALHNRAELTEMHQATFNTLVERKYHQNSANGPGLIVTVNSSQSLPMSALT